MKPKVLYIAVNFFSPEFLDGGNKIIYNLFKCHNKNQKIETHFLSLFPGKQTSEEEKDFSNIFIFEPLSKHQPLLFKILGYFYWFILFQARLKLPRVYAKKIAKRLLKIEGEYHSIHLTSLTLASVADFLPERVLKKTVLSAVDCYSMYLERKLQNEPSFIKRIITHIELSRGRSFESKYYPLFKAIIFVSDVDKSYVQNHLKIKANSFAFPLGVDTDYFSPTPGIKQERCTIIFTGNQSYAPNKDASFFLIQEIFPLIIKQKPQAKLIIAGNGPSKEMQAFASDSIQITGRLPDLRPYTQSSTLFICPLRFGAGMKYKVLESMAMKKTIVCSELSVDGIRHEGIKSCHVVKGFKPQDWANKILELFELQNSENQLDNSEGRELIINQYSWEAMQESYLSLY